MHQSENVREIYLRKEALTLCLDTADLVTKNIDDVGAFKTPSLRLVSQTKPYMHNGLFSSLKGVLNAYNAGMFHPKPNDNQKNDILFPKTSPLLHKLNLTTEELDALEAFLNTL